jgi:hypothetical protein
MSGQSGHLWTKMFEMSGQNKSLDISGQSANVQTSEPISGQSANVRTSEPKGSGEQQSLP